MSDKGAVICLFCGKEAWDMGITFTDNNTASHSYECPSCRGTWQKNGQVDIVWDQETQITRYPTNDFWGVKHEGKK